MSRPAAKMVIVKIAAAPEVRGRGTQAPTVRTAPT